MIGIVYSVTETREYPMANWCWPILKVHERCRKENNLKLKKTGSKIKIPSTHVWFSNHHPTRVNTKARFSFKLKTDGNHWLEKNNAENLLLGLENRWHQHKSATHVQAEQVSIKNFLSTCLLFPS